MHDPNGLGDARSASSRAPTLVAAFSLQGIWSEVSSVSSQCKESKEAKSKNENSVKAPDSRGTVMIFDQTCMP